MKNETMNNETMKLNAVCTLIESDKFSDAEIYDLTHHILGFASFNEIQAFITKANRLAAMSSRMVR